MHIYIVCDTMLFWISFCGVIHAFIDVDEVDNIGLFYAILGIPLTALVFRMMINYHTDYFFYLKYEKGSFVIPVICE